MKSDKRWMAALVAALLLMMVLPARAQTLGNCPPGYEGYLTPRLRAGQIAEIDSAGIPNRVRETPTLDGRYLFDIAPGSQFLLVGGPVCADGVVWWRVVDGERSGWTAESNAADRTYYLRAAPPEVQPPALSLADALRPSGRSPITTESAPLLAQLSYPALTAFAVAVPRELNWLAVNGLNPAQVEILNASEPGAPLALLEVAGSVRLLAADATGERLAVGLIDPATLIYGVQVYAFASDSQPPITPRSPVIDLAGEAPLVALAVAGDVVVTAHSARDGRSENGTLVAWDVASGAVRSRLEMPFLASELALSAEGRYAVVTNVGALEPLTVVFDLEAGTALTSMRVGGELTFDSDLRLFLGGTDGRVLAYQLDLLDGAAALSGLGGYALFPADAVGLQAATALAVSPDGGLLAVGRGTYFDGALPADYVGTIAFVDVATGAALDFRIEDPAIGSVVDLAFSADGTALLARVVLRTSETRLLVYGIPAAG